MGCGINGVWEFRCTQVGPASPGIFPSLISAMSYIVPYREGPLSITVMELIEALSHYPAECEVTFDGYDLCSVDEYEKDGVVKVVLS